MMYKCINCNKEVDLKPEDPVRCPFCGERIFIKMRSGAGKRVKAR